MPGKSLRPTIIIACSFLAGCAVFDGSALSRQRTSAKVVASTVTFRNARSVAEIDAGLNQLVAAKDAQAQAEQLLASWGKQGSWNDLAVVKFLLQHWPSAYSRSADKFDGRRLFETAQTALREKPELCHQVSWYRDWQHGPADFHGLVRTLITAMSGCVKYEGQDYPWGLMICGLVEFDDWLLDVAPRRLSFEDMEVDIVWCRFRIAAVHPYLRYDHGRGIYVLDREAFDAHRYLDAEAQRPSPRLTPLPNWDSDIVPKRPQQPEEADVEVELLGLPPT